MIYGIIPVGGKGTRLGLPFPKEMLPQVGINLYEPIINVVVNKMLEAGAEQIYFVHGIAKKQLIVDYFCDSKYIHIEQSKEIFSMAIEDFYKVALPSESDKILFGMGDTVFLDNPYVDMLQISGIVCGLFESQDTEVTDRFFVHNKIFDVKQVKTVLNTNQHWGILKFDSKDIQNIINSNLFEQYPEVGDIINKYSMSCVYGKGYIDIGTWKDFNRYVKL